MSTVTDHIKKTKTITHYDYDAFGRRTLVQDEGGKIIRTLYDGLSFDIIREQETFADGYFTNTSDTGIAWGAVSEGDGSRYRYIGDDAPIAKEQNGYSVTASNRASSRVALYANGQAVGVTRSSNYASSERSYFGTDLMGTVRSATTDSGSAEYYEYDVFGKPYGETVSDYAYTGKPYDPTTGMYNYGYRDYVPQTARFTTIDPIRDGSNWFAYCNNEPVNFLDLWGLSASDKNKQFSSILQSMVGVPYKYGGKDKNGIDCSGTITESLRQMGYNVDDYTASQLASGKVDWINISEKVDTSKIGDEGTLNFYKLGGSSTVNHVNVGIGTPNEAPLKQIIDATEGDTLNQRKGREGQVTIPSTGQVNQTYAPLSTNPASQPVAQGIINWNVLNEKYKE